MYPTRKPKSLPRVYATQRSNDNQRRCRFSRGQAMHGETLHQSKIVPGRPVDSAHVANQPRRSGSVQEKENNNMIAQQETMTFRPTLAARFNEYDDSNPHVWELFKQFTRDAYKAGHGRFSRIRILTGSFARDRVSRIDTTLTRGRSLARRSFGSSPLARSASSDCWQSERERI